MKILTIAAFAVLIPPFAAAYAFIVAANLDKIEIRHKEWAERN